MKRPDKAIERLDPDSIMDYGDCPQDAIEELIDYIEELEVVNRKENEAHAIYTYDSAKREAEKDKNIEKLEAALTEAVDSMIKELEDK